MNNKMSLIEAKNINNLINASSETAINFANSGFDKTTHLALNRFKKHIFQLLAQVEINIDYPEYDDVPDIKPQQFIKILDHLIKEMSKIIMHSKQLIAVNQGINIAIIGKPNVGKSSLLNAILNSDRVIVSPLAGTTRDVIKESVNIDGITFNFLDTAGIYFTNHKINQLSINKTKEAITRADLILFVVDGSIPLNSQDRYIENLIKTKKHIVVINKSDLISNCHIKGIKVSAKNKKLNNLFEKIIRSLKLIDVNHHSLLLPSTVLIGIMQHCVNNLNKVKKIAIKKQPIDLSLSYLHEAFDDVLSITGENKNIDFVNEMFKHFCVGK
jgi:tRNA modification GTPase